MQLQSSGTYSVTTKHNETIAWFWRHTARISWLGPLSFIILIDDLAVGPILHKYVDDTTISEPLSSTSQMSDIQSHVNSLLLWTSQNSMKLNYTKTKEMLLGPLSKLNVPSLDIDHNLIERVSGFKLLGIGLYILVTICHRMCMLTIFVLEPILVCII